MKICLVGSSGGHLTHLLRLKDWYRQYDHFWVTFKKADAETSLRLENTYWCYYPTNRNMVNLIRNAFLAMKILWKERPDIIISTGAGAAIPFFYIGKILGSKTIFLEVYDRIDKPTLTGRMVYPVTDKFLVQWDEQKAFYKKSENWGAVF